MFWEPNLPVSITLASLELETRACTSLLLELVRLLGQTEEDGKDEEAQLLLRLLSPVMKLYTGKKCIPVISEGMECIGGQGYIEETGIPRILRDAQVTPIWEGTTNILSLDVLRAIGKSKGEVLKTWEGSISRRLKAALASKPELGNVVGLVVNQLNKLHNLVEMRMMDDRSARLLAFSLAEVTIGMLLIEQAAGSTGSTSDVIAATRWGTHMPDIEERFRKLNGDNNTKDDSNELVFDSYSE